MNLMMKTEDLFDKNQYLIDLLSDIKEINTSLHICNFTIPIRNEDIKNDYQNIEENVYKWFYKRKNLYHADLNLDILNFPENYFASFENHSKEFSMEWTPESDPDTFGRVIVNKQNYERKILLPGTFIKQNSALDLNFATQRVKVSLPDREIKEDSYVHFYGESVGDELGENKNTLRFYFNFNPKSNTFLHDLKDNFAKTFFLKLNRRKIPFHIKIARTPNKFYADNVVVYLERRYLIAILDIIYENYARFESSLRPEVPMFTYKLKNGIAFAEGINPNFKEESFGKRMSSLIVKICRKANQNSTDKILINLIKKQHSRSDCCLFLNEQSKFEYTFPSPLLEQNIANPVTTEPLLLDIATRIGYTICKEAFWDDRGRCNWLGFKAQKVYGALGLEFADGLMGILLFLTELFKLTNKPLFKRFGVSLLKTIFEKGNFRTFVFKRGFHGGSGSIFYVLQKATLAFNLPFLQSELDILIDKNYKQDFFVSEPYDVYGGTAGTLWGLLLMRKINPTQFRHDDKIKNLVSMLMHETELWKTDTYFNTSIKRNHERMVGLPHGVSGIAYTLKAYLEIFSINDNQIEQKIKEAIQYEEAHRRFENIWLDALSNEEDFKTPSNSWQLGLCSVGFSQLAFYRSSTDEMFKKNIKAIIEHLNKETLAMTFNNQIRGVLDFYIECSIHSFESRVTILKNLIEIINNFEQGTLALRMNNVNANFVHPSLIGNAGLGLSILRLHDPIVVDSYILPS